jgi:short-subunit dehydrogenase
VVVGASSGLGEAVALRLAARGDALVLAAIASDRLNDVGAECRSRGASVVVEPLDVTDADAVDDLARRAVAEFGRIDAWVHLAATAMFGRFDETPVDDFRRVIDVNVMGYVHGAHAAIEVFRRQGHGVLVNVASIVSEVPAPALASYVTSKFAELGFGKALRADLRDTPGVRVCTVMPGAMDTPLWSRGPNRTGREPRPPAPVYDVGRVARAIVHRIDRPKPEVAVGGAVNGLRFAHRLAPRVSEWLLVRHLARVMYR